MNLLSGGDSTILELRAISQFPQDAKKAQHANGVPPVPWFSVEESALTQQQITDACTRLISEAHNRINPNLLRVLLLPPDLTRAHSGAGRITELLYKELDAAGAYVEVMPTLGQH